VAPDRAYLDRVREIVARRLAGHAVDVYLFGSWARGEARRTSDIDVALLPREDLAASLVTKLREDLDESSVPYEVDVVDLRETTDEFRARVLREGVRWTV
jgi:predicted nucleotidyltransferase